MFEQWKVLHVDEVESESILFCRALAHEQFAGHCESVRSFAEGKAYVERALYTPQTLSRPDIIVINWHRDHNEDVLSFIHWVRTQPQLRETPLVVFITSQLPQAEQDRAQSSGVAEMIVRADDFDSLSDQVHDLLERCASRVVAR